MYCAGGLVGQDVEIRWHDLSQMSWHSLHSNLCNWQCVHTHWIIPGSNLLFVEGLFISQSSRVQSVGLIEPESLVDCFVVKENVLSSRGVTYDHRNL